MFTLATVASSLVERLYAKKTPILLITDIGSDPDDILALLVLLASNHLQVWVADFHCYVNVALSKIIKKSATASRPCLLVAGGGDHHHRRGHLEQGEGGCQVFFDTL